MNKRFDWRNILFATVLAVFGYSAIASADTVAGLANSDMVKCYGCHEDTETQHTKGVHANVNCANCHGGAAEHLASRNKAQSKPQKPDSASCQTCHKNDSKRMNWKFADHYNAGVVCSDCHGIHQAKVVKRLDLSLWRADKSTELCASCHQDMLARFNMNSHHPVKEGGMSCTSCHDPHGGKQTRLLGTTTLCTDCHQRVQGPHVFEHPPAAEDCTSCHNPHGSPNRKLLKLTEPALCLQCHSVAGNRHGRSGAVNNTQIISGAALRQCSSCHSQVHGSAQDQHLRY
jgi:DmsE family decaheme c-type cytochrome